MQNKPLKFFGFFFNPFFLKHEGNQLNRNMAQHYLLFNICANDLVTGGQFRLLTIHF